jgi:hypothetical protein
MKKVIDKQLMREAFDYNERRAYWNEQVTLVAEIDHKNIEQEEFQEEIQEQSPKTQTRRLWQYATAASVLLLVALGIWALSTQTNKQSEPKPYIQKGNGGDKNMLIADVSVDKLLSKSVDDFQATITRKGSADVDNWQADFQAGKYPTVIQSLESVGKKRTVEQTHFLAMAYLKIDPKNTLKAQPLFRLVSTANSDNAREALWLYAIICLRHEQNDAAKTALDEVIEKSNAHKAEAQQLRSTLK